MPTRRKKPNSRKSPSTQSPAGEERLQKVLARAGLGSRREVESWITEGRLMVNGQLATLGIRVGRDDRIHLDGKPLAKAAGIARNETRVLAYHKPAGEVCTRTDPEGRATVFERLPRIDDGRWIIVGRLDINTSGLLLFTNDGELAHRLMHPSSELQREYSVRVLGEVTQEVLEQLRKGVELEDGPAHFDGLRDLGGEGANHWYQVMLREGRNREIHRMWETQGVRVSRLIRVRYGPMQLPRNLGRGRSRDLEPHELKALMEAVDMAVEPRQSPAPRRAKTSRGATRGRSSGPRPSGAPKSPWKSKTRG